MKDVALCDKPRGDESNLRSADFRMGKPTRKGILLAGGEPGELKHLSTRRKGHQHETPLVVASERGPGH